jgi:hypothetical protein
VRICGLYSSAVSDKNIAIDLTIFKIKTASVTLSYWLYELNVGF